MNLVRALLIINPVSGDDTPNTERVESIRTALGGADFSLDVALTEPEKTAGDIAREAILNGVEVIIVGGGDGTVGEVGRALVNTKATLGIIPIGTFNNVARSLEIPPDLDAACAIILQNNTRCIDVGQAGEDHYFLEAAGAGLDAVLFPLGEEIKGGAWTQLLRFFRLAFLYQPPRFKVTFDCSVAEASPSGWSRRKLSRWRNRKTIDLRALFVVAANGPYYGGGFTIAPAARMDDGKLTLAIYRDFGRWELFRHFHSIARGQRRYSSKIITFEAKEIRIDSVGEVPAHVDGFPQGTTPLVLRSVPGALRVFTPKGSAK